MTPTQPGEAATPRTDGFEIVVAGESPVLGNRYRAWAEFARQLERELAALEAQHKAALTVIAKKDDILSMVADPGYRFSETDDQKELIGRANLASSALSLTVPGVADKLKEAEVEHMRQMVEVIAGRGAAEAQATTLRTKLAEAEKDAEALRQEVIRLTNPSGAL